MAAERGGSSSKKGNERERESREVMEAEAGQGGSEPRHGSRVPTRRMRMLATEGCADNWCTFACATAGCRSVPGWDASHLCDDTDVQRS